MAVRSASDTTWHDNWPDVLTSVARVSAFLCGGLALAYAWSEIERPDARWLPVVAWLCLLLVSVAAVYLAEVRPRGAVLTLVGGGALVPLALLAQPGGGTTVHHLLLPAVMAAMLLSPAETAVLLGLLSAALLALGRQGGEAVDWRAFAGFVAAPSLAVAASGHLLRQELARAWRRGEEAAQLAGQVRARGEEVNKLNKALQLSNYLLKRSNYELGLARLEAEEARHAKERFATSVSHELRTPLNIILGFAEMMQAYPKVYGDMRWSPLLRHDIAEVQRNAKYLSDLVDDILDLARAQALSMPIHREWASLPDLIEDTVGVARRLVHDKPVVVAIECRQDLPRLFVDRTRIRQVLLNLLANASRFVDQGSITVGARDEGDEVVTYVRDTGPGIPAEELERVFEEFRQVEDASAQGGRKGSGLGLAVARRFVQLHGGRIWAESCPGKGTTVSFSLPRLPKHVTLSVLPDLTSTPTPPDKPAVTVLDQDADAAAYLTRWLDGYRVLVAADLATAKGQLAAAHPSALILNLPDSSEYDAYAASVTNEVGTQVPVIRCSLPFGSWLLDSRLFHTWLVKPVTAGRLAEALAGVTAAPRVLLVDDDRSFIQLLVRMVRVQRPEAEIAWAHTAEDALSELKQEDWDVLILDIALPDMDGRNLARTARAMAGSEELRILAVSGLQMGEDRDHPTGTTFSVTKSSGLRESELLALLRHTLATVSPAPPPVDTAAASLAAGGDSQAS